MGLREFLFGDAPKKGGSGKFQSVDWSAVEGRWATIETMSRQEQVQKKQAVIQADMLIDSIMKEAGVGGTTMGERLKSLSGKMPREIYQQLWQAHKKRNELVHEQGSFVADWEISQHLKSFRDSISQMRGMR